MRALLAFISIILSGVVDYFIGQSSTLSIATATAFIISAIGKNKE